MPPFPIELAYLWQTFVRLRRRQGSDLMGNPTPLTWRELEAFMVCMQFPLRPWEAELVLDLDDLFLAEMSRARSE